MQAFDSQQYHQEVNEKWGHTQAYAEYQQKGKQDHNALAAGMDAIMAEFAACKQNGCAPASAEAQALVKKLQGYITENFYNCTDAILAGLGEMYVADDRFRANIDRHGDGTAEFIRQAIANR
jgi:hypothetical protein